MEIKLRYGFFGVTVGAVFALAMQFLGVGTSGIRAGVFAVCSILLPLLINAVRTRIKPGN